MKAISMTKHLTLALALAGAAIVLGYDALTLGDSVAIASRTGVDLAACAGTAAVALAAAVIPFAAPVARYVRAAR